MLGQITFLRRRREPLSVISSFTDAFDVYLFRFPQLPTVFTLSYRATLLLDLEQGPVGVFAG